MVELSDLLRGVCGTLQVAEEQHEQRKVISAGIRSAVACWWAPGREFWQCYFLGLEMCCLVHSDALKAAHRYCPSMPSLQR